MKSEVAKAKSNEESGYGNLNSVAESVPNGLYLALWIGAHSNSNPGWRGVMLRRHHRIIARPTSNPA